MRVKRKTRSGRSFVAMVVVVVGGMPAPALASPPSNDIGGRSRRGRWRCRSPTRWIRRRRRRTDRGSVRTGVGLLSFTPAEDVHVQVDTLGSDYDTVLAIYTRDEAGRIVGGSVQRRPARIGGRPEAPRGGGYDLPVHGGVGVAATARATVGRARWAARDHGHRGLERSTRLRRHRRRRHGRPGDRHRDDLRNDHVHERSTRVWGGELRQAAATGSSSPGRLVHRTRTCTPDAPMTLLGRGGLRTPPLLSRPGSAKDEDPLLERLGRLAASPSTRDRDGCDLARVTALGSPGVTGLPMLLVILPDDGRMPERPKGAVCKIAGVAYGGSNPPPPTDAPNHSPAEEEGNMKRFEERSKDPRAHRSRLRLRGRFQPSRRVGRERPRGDEVDRWSGGGGSHVLDDGEAVRDAT